MKLFQEDEWSRWLNFNEDQHTFTEGRTCVLLFGSRKSGKNTLAKGLLRVMKEQPHEGLKFEDSINL
jgi:tRNA A37 threonylcarbamoyladenosine biosynthesis protein TsaE